MEIEQDVQEKIYLRSKETEMNLMRREQRLDKKVFLNLYQSWTGVSPAFVSRISLSTKGLNYVRLMADISKLRGVQNMDNLQLQFYRANQIKRHIWVIRQFLKNQPQIRYNEFKFTYLGFQLKLSAKTNIALGSLSKWVNDSFLIRGFKIREKQFFRILASFRHCETVEFANWKVMFTKGKQLGNAFDGSKISALGLQWLRGNILDYKYYLQSFTLIIEHLCKSEFIKTNLRCILIDENDLNKVNDPNWYQRIWDENKLACSIVHNLKRIQSTNLR
jgi:hypothetical protein